ncbi:hypothetical protein CEXT_748391 [Caerostris extrusa]|uniref:Uncharacterized protein n=1 Tax=Caerostris extrusa TaxID=172846 RepID=A0AAV4W2V5_CAEEX|nr:hypothetical protein CEXT_748391 [Caerostris extrusa]
MVTYNNQEKADVHFMYGLANEIALESRKAVQAPFPEKTHARSKTVRVISSVLPELLQPVAANTHKHVCGSSTTEHHSISIWMCGALGALNSQSGFIWYGPMLGSGTPTRSALSELFFLWCYLKSLVYEGLF